MGGRGGSRVSSRGYTVEEPLSLGDFKLPLPGRRCGSGRRGWGAAEVSEARDGLKGCRCSHGTALGVPWLCASIHKLPTRLLCPGSLGRMAGVRANHNRCSRVGLSLALVRGLSLILSLILSPGLALRLGLVLKLSLRLALGVGLGLVLSLGLALRLGLSLILRLRLGLALRLGLGLGLGLPLALSPAGTPA